MHDSRETSPLGSVARVPGTFAAAPAVYERRVGDWVQWWLRFAHNDQDRGIVRTGRHAGDWEMVQVRLDDAGEPVEAVYAQHSGAERCPWSAVETRGGQPVVYLANGSHAAYFRPGVRDRTWPDPNDEADGRGATVVPPVEPLGDWADWPGRWGGARAVLDPGRDGLPARPGVPAAGPLERPGRLGPRRPAVHVRPLRRGRRMRRPRGPAAARGARCSPPWPSSDCAVGDHRGMPNIFNPEWEAELPGLRGVRVGAAAGGEKLGATLYEVDPGGRVSPLHIHHANEEMLFVVSGRPTLRTGDGERELELGEVVAFPSGRRGVHQVLNRSDEPARVADRLDHALSRGRRAPRQQQGASRSRAGRTRPRRCSSRSARATRCR